MRRLPGLGALVLTLAACDGETVTTSASSSVTTSSSSVGAGSGGAGGAGASSATTGAGGDCAGCAEWILDMATAPLCTASEPLVGALEACLCAECEADCDATCNGGPSDTTDCKTCRQLAAQEKCQTQIDACTSDV